MVKEAFEKWLATPRDMPTIGSWTAFEAGWNAARAEARSDAAIPIGGRTPTPSAVDIVQLLLPGVTAWVYKVAKKHSLTDESRDALCGYATYEWLPAWAADHRHDYGEEWVPALVPALEKHIGKS